MLRRRLLAVLLTSPVLLSAGLSFASEKKEPKKKGGGVNFLQLPTLTANAMRANGKLGILTVDSGLDIKDAALRTKAEQSIPRLRATFIEILQAQAKAISPGTPPDPEILVQVFQRATDKSLGKPGAKFLIGAVMMN